MDVHTAEQRSRNMSRVRGRDTKPEMLVRKGLHAAGFRFRLHDGKLPGRPDIVLPRHDAVVLVHGCFWHGHECPTFRWPASRPDFWQAKISGNRVRDLRTLRRRATANAGARRVNIERRSGVKLGRRLTISGNRVRDLRAHEELILAGWRVATVWECALRGPGKRRVEEVIGSLTDFLRGDIGQVTLEGTTRDGANKSMELAERS
jgi:DNA mismatch endonuclease (patch repair protein)